MTEQLTDPKATPDAFSFGFFHWGNDETEHWHLPEDSPLYDVPKVGIYLIRAYEGTHICSFERSSYAVFLRNEFVTEAGADRDEGSPLQEAIEELESNNGGESGTYFGYIEPNPESPWQSGIHWFDVSPSDLDLAQIARDNDSPLITEADFEGLDLRDLDAVLDIPGMREVWIAAGEYAWREAEEYANANWDSVPASEDRALYDRLTLERAAKRLPALPLMAAAGVDAPAQLPPA